jgi:hypothetical protein
MAASGCDLQSRFRRLLIGDGMTEFQQVCRKRTAAEAGFYEFLLIGHNQRNGATCFWQARSDTFDGEAIPKLDLATATAAERDAYVDTFYLYSEGPSTCTACHANDAFLHSPYLHSAWSIAQARDDARARSRIRPDKPYALVTADQPTPQPIRSRLLTGPGQPLDADCGGCHRVAKETYCEFARGAVAQDRELGALTPADLEVLRRDAAPLMFWMPPAGAGTLAQTLALQRRVSAACDAP